MVAAICSKLGVAIGRSVGVGFSAGGSPAAWAKTVIIPPSMTNSPCAKFTTSEAL